MARIAILLLLLTPLMAAQEGGEPEKADYEYTGEPIALKIECADDDIARFGLICPPEDPCPVYLELTAVDFMKGRLGLVGNIHGKSVTMYSVLLLSDDGGLSWKEPHERLPYSGLDDIHFHDDVHGWALGHVLDGEPHDPFFLLTTDGGRFWRRRPVFKDERAAVVKRFWFESGRSGGLLVDLPLEDEDGARHERWETMTGAESWMIREVSTRPIRVRRVRMRTRSDWRVIADAAAGAWQVQRGNENGWVTVSEFQVQPGACSEAPDDIAEAPPPPEPEETEPAELAPGEKPPLPDELPVAPGGVFVVGAPPAEAAQPVKTPSELDPERPRIERRRP